jgi:hypothetical protein
MQRQASARLFVRLVILGGLVASVLAVPVQAEAASNCMTSDGHYLCVSVPDGSLNGHAPITVTNDPNDGTVIFTWAPAVGSSTYLMERSMPSPETDDYSFVWPTQKYLDGSGVLRIQHGSTSTEAVEVGVSLSNGNITGFQHSASDWADYLPPQLWTDTSDPVLAAVGDSHADEPLPNAVAASIVEADPAQLLFLGDMDAYGTFTENLNHYGVSALDSSSPTLWGVLADKTQPTVGNHDTYLPDWQDYWHGRPDTTSFTFGGVLFLDLDSSKSLSVGSEQYTFVQNALASAPACVVAFWHIPVLADSNVRSTILPMWSLLADNGGDLVLNGHRHVMTEYVPLDASLQSGGHMVELISGAGGHPMAGASSDPRVAWSLGATAGAVYLTLNGAADGGAATSIGWSWKDVDHNVLHQNSVACGGSSPAPTISGFSPISGPPGTSVAISGSGFTGATSVKLNGTAASFTANSGTQITATVPATATTGKISVTTSGGTATSSGNFTVTATAAPTITSFTPTSGPVGTSVVITGTGFTGATLVKFNGTAASFAVDSGTQISATVPATATTGKILVTTPGGTASSTGNFTVSTLHPRSVSLKLRRHLVASGQVSASDGFTACLQNVPVRIQHRSGGGWHMVKSTQTNSSGAYRARLKDVAGAYRARATRVVLGDGAGICQWATSPTRRNR